IHHSARVSILSGQCVLPVLHVEKAAKVTSVNGLREELIAQSEIQCQFLSDLPVVLCKTAEVDTPLTSPVQHWRALYEAGIAEQKIGERQTGARRIPTRGKRCTIDLLSEERRSLQRVETLTADVG